MKLGEVSAPLNLTYCSFKLESEDHMSQKQDSFKSNIHTAPVLTQDSIVDPPLSTSIRFFLSKMQMNGDGEQQTVLTLECIS